MDARELFLRLPPAQRRLTFLNVTKASRLADVDPRTIRHWIEVGDLDAVKVRCHWLVLRASLEALISDGVQKNGAE